jgi:dCMP deaminase
MSHGSEWWDRYFLRLAQHVSTASKDPSTQVGAVVVRPDRTVASVGYNGFPRGVSDDPELYDDRLSKYTRVIHAEMNAVLNAHGPLVGSTLYTWPFMSCDRCAVHMIQVGVARVVAPKASPDKEERWGEAFVTTRALFKEAGIPLTEIIL